MEVFMKVLLFAASVRDDSCNKKLADLINALGTRQNHQIEKLNFADILPPLYDGNLEAKQGLPDIVKSFIKKMNDSEGLIIVSPEYNFSTPCTLKNLIDWVSRPQPTPWARYPIMLCSASPALAGGHRGLLHTVTSLQGCEAHIFPPMFTLGNAYEAFNTDGSLRDQKLQKKLEKNIAEFAKFVEALKAIRLTHPLFNGI